MNTRLDDLRDTVARVQQTLGEASIRANGQSDPNASITLSDALKDARELARGALTRYQQP